MKQLLLSAFVSLFFVTANTQNTGIGTTMPKSKLHVADGDILFTGISPLPATPAAPAVSGFGNRMIWYMQKAALRAGYVNGNNWDKDNVGKYSVAMGYDTKASGDFSLAIGSSTKAEGEASMAIGTSTMAKGVNATATGFGSQATGNYSVAMGYNTKATNPYATAFGNTTEASGYYSLSMGNLTKATGFASTALGSETWAYGQYSTAMGYQSFALADFSTAIGISASAKSFGSLTIGNFNDVTDNPGFTTPAQSDRLFQIGNGSDNNSRHNALTLLRNGNMGIGTLNPDFILDVYGRIRLQSTAGNTAGIWLNNPDNSALNAFMGTNNAQSAGIYIGNSWRFLVYDNGNATLSGTLSQNSDERLKTNIEPLNNSLEMITQLTGYHYQWKDAERGRELQTGVLAQEVEAQMPELVNTGKDGVKSVNYNGLVPYLIESTKQLEREKENQSAELIELKKQNADLVKALNLIQQRLKKLENKQ